MSELCNFTAVEMVELIRSGEVSRREVIEAHLDRITRLNGDINAIVEMRTDQALAEADLADKERKNRKGLKLDGLPITIKDHFDVVDMKHTEGVKTMANRCSPADTPAVKRLREAGAIIIGKCNQPDFQIRWNTISDLYGPTRNPHDLSLSAGGSSGGDAAAVSAGMATLGIGLDYGGSIRVPATFCGIYGLRPSAGRVPYVPTLPPIDPPPTLEFMASTGPLARSVADLRLVFDCLSGADPCDPSTIPVLEPGIDSTSKPRVAKMSGQTGAIIEPAVEAELERTAQILIDSGYDVVDGGIPRAERAPEIWAQLVGTELLHSAMEHWAPQMSDSARQHIETMFGLWDLGEDVGGFISAFIERRTVVRETSMWMENHPLVLTPVAGMQTPALDFDHYLSVDATSNLFDHMRNVMWVNLLSLPAVALPNGVQIVARRFHEAEALEAAAVIEQILGVSQIVEPEST